MTNPPHSATTSFVDARGFRETNTYHEVQQRGTKGCKHPLEPGGLQKWNDLVYHRQGYSHSATILEPNFEAIFRSHSSIFHHIRLDDTTSSHFPHTNAQVVPSNRPAHIPPHYHRTFPHKIPTILTLSSNRVNGSLTRPQLVTDAHQL